MKLNNLKVYCVIEEDQDTMVEVIREMDSECKISTWDLMVMMRTLELGGCLLMTSLPSCMIRL